MRKHSIQLFDGSVATRTSDNHYVACVEATRTQKAFDAIVARKQGFIDGHMETIRALAAKAGQPDKSLDEWVAEDAAMQAAYRAEVASIEEWFKHNPTAYDERINKLHAASAQFNETPTNRIAFYAKIVRCFQYEIDHAAKPGTKWIVSWHKTREAAGKAARSSHGRHEYDTARVRTDIQVEVKKGR